MKNRHFAVLLFSMIVFFGCLSAGEAIKVPRVGDSEEELDAVVFSSAADAALIVLSPLDSEGKPDPKGKKSILLMQSFKGERQYTQMNLPSTFHCLALSADAQMAAVGHENKITIVLSKTGTHGILMRILKFHP